MKHLLPALLLLFFSQLAQADQSHASARRFMDEWVDSFNGNDAKKISAFYEVDERVEMLGSNGLTLKGHEKIAESYRNDMKAVRFYDSKSQEMRIRVFDKTALASFIHRFRYEILGDGRHCEVHIRTTTTLRQTELGWKIVLEHSSAIQGIERVKFLED
ncbi:MAG: nuclear transport factor 2 family protein [Planctomycetota bacterium]